MCALLECTARITNIQVENIKHNPALYIKYDMQVDKVNTKHHGHLTLTSARFETWCFQFDRLIPICTYEYICVLVRGLQIHFITLSDNHLFDHTSTSGYDF